MSRLMIKLTAIVISCLSVAALVFTLYMAYKGYSNICEHGLKHTIEIIWEGPKGENK